MGGGCITYSMLLSVFSVTGVCFIISRLNADLAGVSRLVTAGMVGLPLAIMVLWALTDRTAEDGSPIVEPGKEIRERLMLLLVVFAIFTIPALLAFGFELLPNLAVTFPSWFFLLAFGYFSNRYYRQAVQMKPDTDKDASS